MTEALRNKVGVDEPRYRQVAEHVRARIAEGTWAPGARVPSENELTRSLGVSRMTANRALRELAAEGVLERVQGLGTFVAAPKPQSELLRIRNIREEIEERGHTHSCQVLLLEGCKVEGELAASLGLSPEAHAFHSRLLHLESDLPAALEERWVNPAFAPDYDHQDFTRITPNEYLTGLGQIEAAEHVIEAVRPRAEVRRRLALKADDPCLLLTRRTWSGGMIASRARFFYPGPRYRLAGRQLFTASANAGGSS